MIVSDKIIRIGNSILQHGKYNDRIYLMKLSEDDFPGIIDKLEKLAITEGYSKIFAKVPCYARDKFLENGYLVEASIPRFYNGTEDGYFLGKYFSEWRIIEDKSEKIYKILFASMSKKYKEIKANLPPEFNFKICNNSDVFKITDVFKKVFETYPFPIHDPEYIQKTMNENVYYFSVTRDNNIVALSSSEIDTNSQNVEFTDFATLPEYQGNGLAFYLLEKMENEMQKKNIKVAYTIARAYSYGINSIFSKSGYKYCGTLLNNTNIHGNFESMNVWYKWLQ